MVSHHGWGLDESDGSQGHETPPSAWSDPRPPLLRPHYSAPSDNDRPIARPSRNTPLRTTSSGDYTPFHAPRYSSHDSDLSSYNHFISRPAAPLPTLNIAEVAHGCPPTTHGMFYGEQAHMGYPVVIHPSTMGSLSALTPLAESINQTAISQFDRQTKNLNRKSRTETSLIRFSVCRSN
jgi:hypothetical protein